MNKYIKGIGFDYKYIKPDGIEVLIRNEKDAYSKHKIFAKAMHEILRFHIGRKAADEMWEKTPSREAWVKLMRKFRPCRKLQWQINENSHVINVYSLEYEISRT